MSLPEQVDVVIVGSGAAGSVMAAKLAAGGRQVAILEAGPERRLDQLVSSQLYARRLKWSGPAVIEQGENPVGYVFNAGFGVGGSALHHYAVWPRFHAEDFNSQSRYGEGIDWPINYEDVRPWYDRVQEEVGVSGDATQEAWRPEGADYPLPGIELGAHGSAIKRGFDALDMGTAPLPLAITTTAFNGRPPCVMDGWCDAGCPIGSLANPLATYLPSALDAGAVMQADSPVTRILVSESGDRTTGVEYVDIANERKTISADIVVLAAFAIENPRLLLASANDNHPNGLANSSGLVGKYVMSHPAGLIYGLFPDETESYSGATGGQLVNQDGYGKTTHSESGAFGSYQWMIAQAVKPNDLLGIATTRPDLIGDDLHAFMQTSARHFGTMTAVIEDLPVRENAVSLSEQTDRNGVPQAVVTHTTHAKTKALWEAVVSEGKSVFEAAGATEVWTGPQAAMHIMGGTIMGDDQTSSVTNSYGQCHDIENLVIAGPGLFPTSAGVNPTFTIHALTARSADHLLQNWSYLVR